MRLGLLALILAACRGPGWSEERALAPFVAFLDSDRSGGVEVGEWEDLAWAAPFFREVDLDGDGRLAPPELAAQIRRQDPMIFDADEIRGIPRRRAPMGSKRDSRLTPAARHLLDLLGFLADEARAAGFAGELPDGAGVRAAARTESLVDPAVQALLVRYAAAWAEVGLVFPPGLLRAEAPQPDPGAPSP